MSGGAGKAVAGVVGFGVFSFVMLAFAEVVAMAILGALAALAVGIMIGVAALAAWAKCMRRAVMERDYGWMRDLVLAPLVGFVSAITLHSWVTDKLVAFNNGGGANLAQAGTEAMGKTAFSIVAFIAGPVAGILLIAAIVYTPGLLALRTSKRLLAYPVFFVMSAYLAGTVIAITSGQI